MGMAVMTGRLIAVVDGQPRALDGTDSQRGSPQGRLGHLRPLSLTASGGNEQRRAPEGAALPAVGSGP